IRIELRVYERALGGVPVIQPLCCTHPQSPDSIYGKREHTVIAQRARVMGVMPEVLDLRRCRVQNTDTCVARSYPDLTFVVQGQSRDCIARQRSWLARVVAIDGEAVRGPIPACEAATLDGDPKVMPRVLDDLVDEIARKAPTVGTRVRISVQLV